MRRDAEAGSGPTSLLALESGVWILLVSRGAGQHRLGHDVVLAIGDLSRPDLLPFQAVVVSRSGSTPSSDRVDEPEAQLGVPTGAWQAGMSFSNRSHGSAAQVSVCAWPKERGRTITFAATVSSGASNTSR
jgi:hypothetical protein